MSEQENHPEPSNPNEKVNFFGRQVTRAQMEPFLKFYDADHQLTTEDRKTMATELKWVSNSAQMWGMFDASLAFFAPTFYRRYTTSKVTKVAESWRNMPVRNFIHKPFLSVFLGTATYFVSIVYHAKTSLDYQVGLLSKEIGDREYTPEQVEAKKRQLSVWKTMVPSQMTFYYLYYWKSSTDPSLVLKNPLSMTENPHEVHYVPPAEQEDHQHRTPFGTHQDPEAPHWAKIRAANGFAGASEPEKESSSLFDDVLEDPITAEQIETAPEVPETKKSAWDRIRRGN